MWKNLRNVGSALGNVVAPPIEDEDDDGAYEEEAEEDEYEEEEEGGEEVGDEMVDEEDYDEDGGMMSSAISQASPFAMVAGMLGSLQPQFPDDEDDDDEELEEDDEREEEVDKVTREDSGSFAFKRFSLQKAQLEEKLNALHDQELRQQDEQQQQIDEWEDETWDHAVTEKETAEAKTSDQNFVTSSHSVKEPPPPPRNSSVFHQSPLDRSKIQREVLGQDLSEHVIDESTPSLDTTFPEHTAGILIEPKEKLSGPTITDHTHEEQVLTQDAQHRPTQPQSSVETFGPDVTVPSAQPTTTLPNVDSSSSIPTDTDGNASIVSDPPVSLGLHIPIKDLSSGADTATNDKKSDDMWKAKCALLEERLRQAENQILEMQKSKVRDLEQAEEQQQAFRLKEARLLQAATEEHDQELSNLQRQHNDEISRVQREYQQLERKYHQAKDRVAEIENSKGKTLASLEATHSQKMSRLERSLQSSEDKLAQAMATLEQRNDEIHDLQTAVSELNAQMAEQHDGAEEEMDELQTENEHLAEQVEGLQTELLNWKTRAQELQADAEKMSGLKMELKLMKEERERDRAKTQSQAASAESNTAQLEAARGAALARVDDLERQLQAALADLDIARADTDRVMVANQNLQTALESFQTEREAEMGLLEEHRQRAEEATAAAHAAALEATMEANEARIREIQSEQDSRMRQTETQKEALEQKLEALRQHNEQMRMSLDEAIRRLQTTQEDVVDRSMMKNILLDWLTNGKEKKKVLEVMASLLHFSDDEKERVRIGDANNSNSFGLSKVVEQVAAPLPPPKSNLEQLQGENVREKWVNFLLAETDE